MASLGWLCRLELVLPLGRGLQANVRWSYPLGGPLVRDDPSRFDNDRAVLAYAFKPRRGFLAQVVGGRFPSRYVTSRQPVKREGVAVELAKPYGKRGLLRGVWADLSGDIPGQGPYYVGEYWHLLPSWDTQVRILSGRFLGTDRGFGVDVTRYFGELQLGVGVRSTGAGERAEVKVAIPLSSRRQPQGPSTLRVRLPDRFEHTKRSLLNDPNLIVQAQLLANELIIGPDLIQGYLNQNRILTDQVKARLR